MKLKSIKVDKKELLHRYIETMEFFNCIFIGYDDKEIIFQIPDNGYWTLKKIAEIKREFLNKFELELKVRRLL